MDNISSNGQVVTVRDSGVQAGWSLWYCHMSDLHFDSIKCDIDLLTKHLRLAEERNAIVDINGDIFDAMQSRDDPRRNMDELKAEYKVSHYTDALVMYAADYFLQFKVRYIFGLGNHETALIKKLNTNLIDRLAHEVRRGGGEAINTGKAAY